jgi:hypothetical protein
MMTIAPGPGAGVLQDAPANTAGMLAALNRAVGGYIEPCPLPAETALIAYVNEDGEALGLDPNPAGTAVLRALGWRGWTSGPFVLGPVVILGRKGTEEVSLTDAQVARLSDLMGVTL